MSRRGLENILAWVGALWIAFEFLWYEQYKLAGPTLVFDRRSAWSGIPETPFRLFVASMEIASSILVLIPRTQGFGALFAVGIMSGAIFFHLFTPLGVDPYNDGAQLFKEACFTLVIALIVAFLRRAALFDLARWALPRIGLGSLALKLP